jgi:radical SAM protein with 4Fe4S-binding SPASM domain
MSAAPELNAVARPIDRATRPIYAVWELTLGCDLACKHCSSRAGKPRSDELSTAEALALVPQLEQLGVQEVTLIGGEAYLRADWLIIVSAIRKHGMRCTLVSGGRGLNAERVSAARDAGLQAVSISIDGLEASHDALRALKGSYAAAMNALKLVRASGMQATVNSQIGAQNFRDMPALYAQLLDEGIAAWQAQITVAMGRAADHPEVLLQPYQMLEVMPMLARLKRQGDTRGVVFWAGNNVGYFGPHEAELREMLPHQHRGSCGAGRAALGIEANGNLKGCPSLPSDDYVGGNIRSHALIDLWERSPEVGFMRERTADSLWGRCKGCYYAQDCLGGCSWTAHSVMGRPGNNPYCHHRALTLLDEGLRERVVQRSAPPGDSFDLGEWDLIEEPWPDAQLPRAKQVAAGEVPWLQP